MAKTGEFQVAQSEGFPLELGRAPKKVQNAWTRTILPTMRERPHVQDPPKIKKLKGYKDLWRLRISDSYRLVYQLDTNRSEVTLLILGHRKDIYDRLDMQEDGRPGTRIVAVAPDILDPQPTPEARGRAIIERGQQASEPADNPNSPLPRELTEELLREIGVPSSYFRELLQASTEGELMSLCEGEVPSEVVERILDYFWPKKIEEVIQKPVRVPRLPEEIVLAGRGERSLESFLLKLDDDQKSFVSRFSGKDPVGPWLLKGGPGSGKSTVALYCIKEILNPGQGELPLQDRPKILFTTFTHSLVNASNHLLGELSDDNDMASIEVRTVDSLAWKNCGDEMKPFVPVGNREAREYARRAVSNCRAEIEDYNFVVSDHEFLLDEIEWVIVGQDLGSVDEYLNADRAGRGRPLTRAQRQQVWKTYEELTKLLRAAKKCLFSERLRSACNNVSARYDYVFIDEAQDLKPVAVRFCVGLSKDPRRVFLTADTNQSIYGTGLSWVKIASDLKVAGRTRILRKNYRTTSEIWSAIQPLAEGSSGVDSETLEIEPVYSGPEPVLARYSSTENLARTLNSYLYRALKEQRATIGSAAVLCPTSREMTSVMQMLDPKFRAMKMRSSEVDLSHPGLKVMTMHAAKGLQFPVVAVVGVNQGRLPLPTPIGMDEEEHTAKQQRLLFVACSRAMRQLIVFTDRSRPSQFIRLLSDDHWEYQDL